MPSRVTHPTHPSRTQPEAMTSCAGSARVPLPDTSFPTGSAEAGLTCAGPGTGTVRTEALNRRPVPAAHGAHAAWISQRRAAATRCPGPRAAAGQGSYRPEAAVPHTAPIRPPRATPGMPLGAPRHRGRRTEPAGSAAVSAAAWLPPTGLVTAPLGLPRVPMGLPFCSSLATLVGGGPLTSGLPLPLSGLSRRQGLSLLRSMLGDAAPAGRSQ